MARPSPGPAKRTHAQTPPIVHAAVAAVLDGDRATAHFRGPGAPRPAAKVLHTPLGVTIIDIDEETAVLLDDAIAALRNRGPALRRRLLACQGVELYYAQLRDRSGALSGQAVKVARSCGHPAALGFALNARARPVVSDRALATVLSPTSSARPSVPLSRAMARGGGCWSATTAWCAMRRGATAGGL